MNKLKQEIKQYDEDLDSLKSMEQLSADNQEKKKDVMSSLRTESSGDEEEAKIDTAAV